MLLASLAARPLAYLWLGFADALWMLFAARLLAGACAGNIAAAQAYIADVTPPENRAKGMGMIGAAFGLGFTIGPALGGLVAGTDPRPPRRSRGRPFWRRASSALAFVVAAARLKESLPPSRAAARRGRAASRRSRDGVSAGRCCAGSVLFFVTSLAFAGMETTFALWARSSFGWGPRAGRLRSSSMSASCWSAVQGGLIGRLSRRFGEARLVLAGAAIDRRSGSRCCRSRAGAVASSSS